MVINSQRAVSNYIEPKISIVIPIYNSEKYINKCLDSICNQSLSQIEIICVNDGSTDLSRDIINKKSEKDQRIVIINQKNKGVCAARKLGILNSSAQHIYFIDSDDYIEIDCLKNIYKIAIIEDADIVISGESYNFDDINCVKKKLLECNYRNSLSDLEKCKLFVINTGVCNKLYKKELLIKALPYYENTGCDGEDAQLSLYTLFFAKKVTYFNDDKYYYRITYNSLTRKKISLSDIKKTYNIYNDIIKRREMQNCMTFYLYRKFVKKRRNMHIYKQISRLEKISSKLKFLFFTKDVNLSISCFFRFIVKQLLPRRLKEKIYNIYYRQLNF